MRGVGEPIFEHDFLGTDMVAEIREGPYAKERFEMELAARLRGFEYDDDDDDDDHNEDSDLTERGEIAV